MKNGIKFIIAVIFLITITGYFFGGGLENQVENEMNKIEVKVAEDAIKQYEIAKRNGYAIDAYVQAGLVAASFLQADDEENYRKWKQIEEQEEKNVGL
ncbi:MAG: hypothetical protein WBG90_10175 [Saonia sp.]